MCAELLEHRASLIKVVVMLDVTVEHLPSARSCPREEVCRDGVTEMRFCEQKGLRAYRWKACLYQEFHYKYKEQRR